MTVKVSSFRQKDALNEEIIDLQNEKSSSEVGLVYKFDKKSNVNV